MKKTFILLLLLGISISLFGQEEKKGVDIQLETGFLFHWNTFNIDRYLDNRDPTGSANATGLVGIDLRFTIPTKLDYLDFSFGTVFEKGWDTYISSSTDYVLNGGGVYAGICPKIKMKHFGLTSLIAVGVLSYKEYYYYYSTIPDPDIDLHERKTSFGLGAITSLGAYVKFGRVGIHPQIQAVFSGGSNASFFFYGAVIPLTIQF
jgi:hypothetical protein